jgi:hypothetical protein
LGCTPPATGEFDAAIKDLSRVSRMPGNSKIGYKNARSRTLFGAVSAFEMASSKAGTMKLQNRIRKFHQLLQVQADSKESLSFDTPLRPKKGRPVVLASSLTLARLQFDEEKPTKLVGGPDAEVNLGQ